MRGRRLSQWVLGRAGSERSHGGRGHRCGEREDVIGHVQQRPGASTGRLVSAERWRVQGYESWACLNGTALCGCVRVQMAVCSARQGPLTAVTGPEEDSCPARRPSAPLWGEPSGPPDGPARPGRESRVCDRRGHHSGGEMRGGPS